MDNDSTLKGRKLGIFPSCALEWAGWGLDLSLGTKWFDLRLLIVSPPRPQPPTSLTLLLKTGITQHLSSEQFLYH
jgi:hypothetical protein